MFNGRCSRSRTRISSALFSRTSSCARPRPALLSLLPPSPDRPCSKKSQAIEESYKWWRDGVEFSLVRILALPPTLLSPDSAQTFPLLADLPAVAPMWMLYARVVAPESTPAQVGQCIEQLNDIHAKLFGVFDFKLFDRRVHDTRFAPQQAGAVRA